MHMSVDEAGQRELSRQVHPDRAGHGLVGEGGHGQHGFDSFALNYNRHVAGSRRAGAVDDRQVGVDRRRGRRDLGPGGEGDRADTGRKET